MILPWRDFLPVGKIGVSNRPGGGLNNGPQIYLQDEILKNIYLAALGLSCGMWTLSCSMWDLVPQPGIKLGPPALADQSLSH